MEVIDIKEKEQWEGVLARSAFKDFYYWPWYQQMEADKGYGVKLLIEEAGGDFIALPVVIEEGKGRSVYGYSGPIASRIAIDEGLRVSFFNNAKEYIAQEKLKGFEIRLHPVFKDTQHAIIREQGRIRTCGKTVCVDLSKTQEERWKGYEHGHRSRINKAKRAGIVVVEDTSDEGLEVFMDIYEETMRYLGADARYYFDEEYFEKMLNGSQGQMRFFHVKDRSGKVLCSGLFGLCGEVMQFHLSGTRESARKGSPSRLLLHEVMEWAKAKGARWAHLGGGLGAREDALYEFKAGFGGAAIDFCVWDF